MATHHDLALGRIAVEEGLITRDQLEACLTEQVSDPKPLGVLLMRRGLLNDEALRRLLTRVEAAGSPVDAQPVRTPTRSSAVDSAARPAGPPQDRRPAAGRGDGAGDGGSVGRRRRILGEALNGKMTT